MKIRTGIALVLVLALPSLGFAQRQAGPPLPEGCVFDKGTTICTEVSDEMVREELVDQFVTGPPGGRLILICIWVDHFERTTTVSTYRGVSNVLEDQTVTITQFAKQRNGSVCS